MVRRGSTVRVRQRASSFRCVAGTSVVLTGGGCGLRLATGANGGNVTLAIGLRQLDDLCRGLGSVAGPPDAVAEEGAEAGDEDRGHEEGDEEDADGDREAELDEEADAGEAERGEGAGEDD